MRFILHVESADEEPQAIEFPDANSAIAYAAWWFINGYSDDADSALLAQVYIEAGDLIASLLKGEAFICGRLCEEVKLESRP